MEIKMNAHLICSVRSHRKSQKTPQSKQKHFITVQSNYSVHSTQLKLAHCDCFVVSNNRPVWHKSELCAKKGTGKRFSPEAKSTIFAQQDIGKKSTFTDWLRNSDNRYILCSNTTTVPILLPLPYYGSLYLEVADRLYRDGMMWLGYCGFPFIRKLINPLLNGLFRALTWDECVDDDLTKIFPVRNAMEYTCGFLSLVFEKILQ